MNLTNKKGSVGNARLLYFNDDGKPEIFHINEKKRQGILTTNMLEYLETHNSFASDVYMKDIAEMICQLHHLHFEQYLIQQQCALNWRYLC